MPSIISEIQFDHEFRIISSQYDFESNFDPKAIFKGSSWASKNLEGQFFKETRGGSRLGEVRNLKSSYERQFKLGL